MTQPRRGLPGGVLGDGGLQVERTALAWRRTECSVAVCALVGLRLAAHLGDALTVAAAAALLVGAVAVIAVDVGSSRKSVVDAGPATSRSIPTRAHVLAVLTATLGILALIATLHPSFGPEL